MYSPEDVAKITQKLEERVDIAERAVEDLEGQVLNLKHGLEDLARHEKQLLMDLEAASLPRNLGHKRKLDDVAIDLAALRAGITELGNYARDRTIALERARARVALERENLDDFRQSNS